MPDNREPLHARLSQARQRRSRLGTRVELLAFSRLGPPDDLREDLRSLERARQRTGEEQVDFRKPPGDSRCALTETMPAFGRQRASAIIWPALGIALERDAMAHDEKL